MAPRAGRRHCVWLLAIVLTAGCSAEPARPDLEEWFRDTQGNTNTTHGWVDPETVREDNGAIIFSTSEGVTLRQQYRPDGGTGYDRMGDPEPVPASDGR
jgi:hypothetical protein